MISAVLLFLASIGCFALSVYLKGVLYFGGNIADLLLFWFPVAVGVVLVFIGIDRLERRFGLLNAALDRRDAKLAQKAKAKSTADAAKTTAQKRSGKNDAWSFKTGGGWGSIGFTVAYFVFSALFMAAVCFGLNFLADRGKLTETLHWIPIVIALLFYLCLFTALYTLNVSSPILKKVYPIEKTENEVRAAIDKTLRETGYAYYHLRVAWWSTPFFILQAAVAYLITPYALNFLVATPLLLLFALINRHPQTARDIINDFLAKHVCENWKQHLCPKCKAILGKYHLPYSHVKTGEDQYIGSETYNVTEEYTNGYDTLRVHRTEKEYFIKTDSKYRSEYACPRCHHRWVENKSYSSKEYI